jgi:hypothetical protein
VANPILGGLVKYFRIVRSSQRFSYIKHWVEKKIRRHIMRARNAVAILPPSFGIGSPIGMGRSVPPQNATRRWGLTPLSNFIEIPSFSSQNTEFTPFII